MKHISNLLIALLLFSTSLSAQIKIGFLKSYKKFPDELYIAGYLAKDSIKDESGEYSYDIKKFYFLSQASIIGTLITGPTQSQDVARMNINGKDMFFTSKIRKRTSDHDQTKGTTWFSNKNGYKLKYEEIKFLDGTYENSSPTKIRLTVFYKKNKKVIELNYTSKWAN